MARESADIAAGRVALGKQLAEFREAADMRQGALARVVFRDRTTVSHIEHGRERGDEQFWTAADHAVKADGVLLRSFRELEAAKHAHEQQLRDAVLVSVQASAVELRARAGDQPQLAAFRDSKTGPAVAPRFLPEVISRLSATMLAGRRHRPPGGTVSLVGKDRVDIGVLKDRVWRAWQFRQQANYTTLGGHLAQLIPDIEASAVVLAGDEQCEVLRLMVHAYNAASSLLKRLGDIELALLAADRAVRTAHSLDDPLLTAAADYRLGNVLLEAGRFDDTGDVVLHAADTIAPGKTAVPLGLASWGGLLLTAAVAYARQGDACHAWELLGEARMASRLLGSEYADIHTIFGPTNVGIYSVQIAAELGNGHDAVRRGKQMDVEHLPPGLRERRSQFFIDLAQGYVLLGSDDVATETLLRAENTAPEEVRFNTTAHRLVHTMLGRERLGATPDLRDLARRMSIER